MLLYALHFIKNTLLLFKGAFLFLFYHAVVRQRRTQAGFCFILFFRPRLLAFPNNQGYQTQRMILLAKITRRLPPMILLFCFLMLIKILARRRIAIAAMKIIIRLLLI